MAKNLTDINSNVGQTNGLAALGNAALFTDTDHILRNTSFSLPSSFTISLWMRFSSLSPDFLPYIIAGRHASDANIYWEISALPTIVEGGDGTIYFTANDTSGIGHYTEVVTAPGDGIIINTNYWLAFGYDAETSELFIRINNISLVRAAKNVLLNISNVLAVSKFVIGNGNDTGAFDGSGVNGWIQQVACWDRVLGEDEMDLLYNGGVGFHSDNWG